MSPFPKLASARNVLSDTFMLTVLQTMQRKVIVICLVTMSTTLACTHLPIGA
jgi:hypothetical protein